MSRRSEEYAIGLITEECAEVVMLMGKALRFGFDAPGPDVAPYHVRNVREMLPAEAGDVLAAFEYAQLCGILDMGEVMRFASIKLERLLDPDSRDAEGRRLAPEPRP